jgi:ornithine cyclodeaminase
MQVKILTESELRELVTVDAEAITAIESAFTWLAEERVEMPPIMHISVPENKGDVDIKAAYVRGLDNFAVKMGAGFFENHRLGLPNSPAMMVVLSAKTGFAEAVLLDNAYLTDVRTGAAGAVAAKHLSPEQVRTAGVIGTGAQGRYQMQALKQVRDYKRLMAFDLNADSLKQYVEEMAPLLGVEIIAAAGPQEVVEASQVVVTSTPSKTPYVKPEWLHPGMHLTCMGADLPGKGELIPEALGRIDLIVCDRKTQCFSMGELHNGLEAGVITEDASIFELGEVTSGKVPGRQSADQVTFCDLTGTGVQDTAIATLALRKADECKLGTNIDIGFD